MISPLMARVDIQITVTICLHAQTRAHLDMARYRAEDEIEDMVLHRDTAGWPRAPSYRTTRASDVG